MDAGHGLIGKLCRKLRGASVTGNERLRRHLHQGNQHESALMHARMRHFQSRLVDHLAAEQEQVEIQRARAVRLAPHATMPRFQRQELLEQLAWRERGIEYRHSVDELGLVRLARWRRTIQGRVPDQTRLRQLRKLEDALLHLTYRIREIGPQADMRNLEDAAFHDTGSAATASLPALPRGRRRRLRLPPA